MLVGCLYDLVFEFTGLRSDGTYEMEVRGIARFDDESDPDTQFCVREV